jgi:hypothetical protein
MRGCCKVLVAVVVAGVASGSTSGQSLAGSRFTDPATLIQNKAVQKHLELDEKTIQKAFNIPILIRQSALADFKALADVKDPIEHEKRKQELKKRTMKAGIDELGKILDPGDLRRLRQIAMQMADFQAFTTEDVRQTLKLTPEQQSEMKSVVRAGNDEMRDLIAAANVSAGDMEAMWKVSKPARRKAMQQAMAVLTPEQRQTWQSLVGEEFDFSLERPGKDLLPRGGGPVPATEAQKADVQWLAKRIDEWMPKDQEKNFDQIAWMTQLVEAMKLAKVHNRGVFIFVLDGDVGTGRC